MRIRKEIAGSGLFGFLRCVAACLVIAFAFGCAEQGPILIEGLTYQAPEGLHAGKASTVVAVSVLRDLRDAKPSVIGQRKVGDSFVNDLVVQGTAADIVAAAMQDALKIRGIAATSAPVWDLNETSIKAEGADILVGGEIKKLWIEVVSQPFNVTYKAGVQLRVSAADVKERKIVRTLNLNSSIEREDISWSDSLVREMLAESLSSAINQLLNDEELKKKIH